MPKDVSPFKLSAEAWANLQAVMTIIGVTPIIAAAILYVGESDARNTATIAEAWRTINLRPLVDVGYLDGKPGVARPARNWGVIHALETLTEKKQILNSIDLLGADLSDARLNSGKFGWAGFRGVNFSRAHLANADFTCADVRSAQFVGAELTNTTFVGANISGAHFSRNRNNAVEIDRILKTACKDPSDKWYGAIVDHDGDKDADFRLKSRLVA